MVTDDRTFTVNPRIGRGLFLLGWALVLLGLIVYGVQFLALKQFVVPWYAPILGTMGALAMSVAILKRRSATRLIGLVVCILLTAVEWTFLLSLSRLPAYAGPEAGAMLPSFAVARADGSSFANNNLVGQATVLLFFRGRW